MGTLLKITVSIGLLFGALLSHAADGYYYYGQYFGFTGDNTAVLIAPVKSDNQMLRKNTLAILRYNLYSLIIV